MSSKAEEWKTDTKRTPNARKPDQNQAANHTAGPGFNSPPPKKSPRKRAEQGNKEVAHTKTRAMSAPAAAPHAARGDGGMRLPGATKKSSLLSH